MSVNIKYQTIPLVNMKNDGFTIDTAKIDSCKSTISADLKNIKEAVNAIGTAYKTMANDKGTSGTWKDVANSCVKAATTYGKNLSSTKRKLQNNLTDSLLAYIMAFIQNAQRLQVVANNISTESEGETVGVMSPEPIEGSLQLRSAEASVSDALNKGGANMPIGGTTPSAGSGTAPGGSTTNFDPSTLIDGIEF